MKKITFLLFFCLFLCNVFAQNKKELIQRNVQLTISVDSLQQEVAKWKEDNQQAQSTIKEWKISSQKVFEENALLEEKLKSSQELVEMRYDTMRQLKGDLGYLKQQLALVTSNLPQRGDGKPCQGAPTVTDRDGNTYNTVQIGDQCWMRENLRTTRYADGTSIAQGGTTFYVVAYYWYYPDGNPSNKSTYGLLYNWKAVMRNSTSSDANPSGVKGICPTGWHVPSDAEWTQLLRYVGNRYHESNCMCGNGRVQIAKSLASTIGWPASESECAIGNNPSRNNATGFSAVPADHCYYDGYGSFGYGATFWSATEDGSSYAYDRSLYYDNAYVDRNDLSKSSCSSVRCLRD